ncbi:MAG: ParA family protein [Gammaproteobacteria bacterium]
MSKTPIVISVINLKGGVGKTTVTALLAHHAARHGLDVLAVDLDPQANLSQALMTEQEYQNFMDNREPSIVELFDGYAPASQNTPGPTKLNHGEIVKSVGIPNENGLLEVIPSRFDFSDNLVRASQLLDKQVLAKFIAEHMQHKDLILIDCAPTESVLTRASYHASRYVLIPVKTEFFSTIGFPLLKKSLDDFCSGNRGHQIDVCGIVVRTTKTSGSVRSKDGRDSLEDISGKANEYGWHVFENRMEHSDGYPKMARDPDGPYLGNAVHEWPKIANEILAKIGLSKPEAAQ